MKWWKQYLLGIFSLCAMVLYVQSEMPVVSVSSTYQRSIQLYYVNETMDLCMVEKPFVCANTMDCLLKSYTSMDVLEDVVIEDMVLEEGMLVMRVSSFSIALSKEKEALLMYLLQFSDVNKVKIYVDEELWDGGVYVDSKKVISNHFSTFTSDLYMSMPVVMYENNSGVEIVKTIRVPYSLEYKDIVQWMLYVYDEHLQIIDECHVVDGYMLVSLNGELNDMSHIESMGLSLLLLEEVNEISILHEQIEIYHKVY
ncbi:MAG: hypothetical protein IKY26_05775 [Erysipelotrichaceae bacterium]|nr:hypothetical protein [Erysipelotrichaceae bacterium]